VNDRTQFENYLREFEPRQPRALPSSARLASSNWRRLVATATVLVACSFGAWLARRARPLAETSSNSSRAATGESVLKQFASNGSSLIILTRLATQEPLDFEAILNEQSRQVLIRFDQASGALRVLAKE
jgi:hypothetical protein